MKTFAVVNNNIVINIIVANTKEIAEEITGFTCIEYTEKNPAGIGYTWDGTQFINLSIIKETND